MNRFNSDKATHRLNSRDGKESWLVTHARSKVRWAHISRSGKVHRITHVIIRWNSNGGTWNKPDVTFVTACGPQRHVIWPASNPPPMYDVCARCDRVPPGRSILDIVSNQR